MLHLKHYYRSLAATVAMAALWSCSETIDTSARYVFKEETALSYLQKHDVYSSYVELLDQVNISQASSSTVSQLLSARGAFTVFAPTNEAIQKYLESLVEDGLIATPSWDAFTDENKLDSIRKVIVYNSVIDGGDTPIENFFYVADFPTETGAEFVIANLNDRKISVIYDKKDPEVIWVGDSCEVSKTERDILSINGVIHQVDKVIAPSDIPASNYIANCLDEKKGDFLVCFRAIEACGLYDTLSAVRDENYEQRYVTGQIKNLEGMTGYGFAEGSIGYAPEHRKYGFTIFAETDDFWREQGINPTAEKEEVLEKLTQWILDNHQYSDEDKFITDNDLESYRKPEHLLYQWITYHILPMRIPTNKLVFHINEFGYVDNGKGTAKRSIPVYEYYTTMGQRRLFKLLESRASNGVYINRFPIADYSRGGTGLETGCDPDKVGALVNSESASAVLNEINNCNIYPIDAPISYNDEVRDNLHKERIRFDGMSLFPEAMNNDIRLTRQSAEKYVHVFIPKASAIGYDYFENMIQNEDANFVYYNTAISEDWCNLYHDEMKAVGRYEFTFKLPPVPRTGTYEVRYKVLANGNRGVAQIYFGTNPDYMPVAGIPLDLTVTCDNAITGWKDDVEGDDDTNAETDKQMRNKGYMKAPCSITVKDGSTERDYSHRENIRHIFVRQTLRPEETYYLKLKSVLDSDKKEFYMDFIEYCPKEVYDNPEDPEDIW